MFHIMLASPLFSKWRVVWLANWVQREFASIPCLQDIYTPRSFLFLISWTLVVLNISNQDDSSIPRQETGTATEMVQLESNGSNWTAR